MSPNRIVALGLGLGLLFAAAPARADSAARWWLVPGGQVSWPSKDLGLERRALGLGGIVGYRLSPAWSLEGRVHYTEFEPPEGTTGPGSNILHGAANLTWMLAPKERWSPYITGGLGGADFS